MAKVNKTNRAKSVSDKSYASNQPGGDHAMCDSDADCAALAKKLKLDDQSGAPAPMSSASAGDRRKLETHRKFIGKKKPL
jgi:hypothetical protein